MSGRSLQQPLRKRGHAASPQPNARLRTTSRHMHAGDYVPTITARCSPHVPVRANPRDVAVMTCWHNRVMLILGHLTLCFGHFLNPDLLEAPPHNVTCRGDVQSEDIQASHRDFP